MANLGLTKVGAAWYLVRLEGRATQWSKERLVEFLQAHGYTVDDIDAMLEQADSAYELEIFVPEERLR